MKMLQVSLFLAARGIWGALACAMVVSLGATPIHAAGPYDRIEEDWELILNTPDGATGSPQIAFEMTPEAGSPLTGIFLINDRDTPNFLAGGVQVQLWNGDTNTATADFGSTTLANVDEKITFTLYMDRQTAGQLKYGVLKGQCTTWGDLGKAPLNVSCPDTMNTFTNYLSANSVSNAQIMLGANRVKSLKLIQVRKYYVKGQGKDTETGITVYP